MIYQNVELHNVDELIPQEDGSVRLQRVPESLRQHLNDAAKARMRSAAGVEIRFVNDGDSEEITLSVHPDCEVDAIDVVTFYGDHQYSIKNRITKQPTTFSVPMHNRLRSAAPECLNEKAFSRHVRRLRFGGGDICFHSVKGEGVRPPKPEEIPAKRVLMYGTSITQGAAATGPHLTYAAITARKLGMDLINLGSGGSCFCEPEKADYIAARKDWDVAVLALSVNMRGIPGNEFYERVSYVVNTVASVGRPVVCITLWPFFGDMTDHEENGIEPGAAPAEEFRQKLRDAVKNCPYPNVSLLEGPELLTDINGLGGDMIHPGDMGMMEMGTNLAAAMKRILG